MKLYHPASHYRENGKSSFRLQLVLTDVASPLPRPPKYQKATPCSPIEPTDTDEFEVDLVDDSWLVAPYLSPQVTLTVNGVVARCDGGVAGCAVPPLTATTADEVGGRRRRRTQQAAEKAVDPAHPTPSHQVTGLDTTATASSRATTAGAGVSSAAVGAAPAAASGDAEETDDNLKFHPEAPFLPPIDDLAARAPLLSTGAEQPLGELRRAWAQLPAHSPARRLSADSMLRWSDSATWGGAPPPTSAQGTMNGTQIVFIPSGTHLLLDVPSVYVRIWVIEGSLSFADELNITLEAEAIIINHGELHVGSASTPFTHEATFLLRGHWQSAQLPVFGIKTIGLTHGKLSLHGQPRTPWLKLAATATAGTSTLTLESAPDGWQVGDALSITTISQSPLANCTLARDDECQVEEASVLSIDGATVTLVQPLRYNHAVESVSAAGRTVLLASEVINLKRNVRIVGSTGPGSAGFGGHVMLLQPTDGSTAIHYVELHRMGQAMRVGRYPLHLHAVTAEGGVGDLSGTSVVGVSVHHSFNRGINIHGGTGATVRNSTIYKNLGHAFFVEVYPRLGAIATPARDAINCGTVSRVIGIQDGSDTCIHAYMHTCIHAYMHTCILAYLHTCILAYLTG